MTRCYLTFAIKTCIIEVNITDQALHENEVFIKDFFSKYDQIRRKLPDLLTFTEETLNGKLLFSCSVSRHLGYILEYNFD